jgi:hypothetical protein
LWTYRNDVYLAARALGRFLKVSLHQSGRWRVAYTKNIEAAGTRLIVEWSRPSARVAEGIGILVPPPLTDVLGTLPVDTEGDPFWFGSPGRGHGRYFKILFSPISMQLEKSVITGVPVDTLLGPIDLPRPERVWLLSGETPLDAGHIKDIEYARTTRISATPRTGIRSAAAHVVSWDDAGPSAKPPLIIDVALCTSNVVDMS